jgi:hypothetical protein
VLVILVAVLALMGWWLVRRRAVPANLLLVTIDTLRADHVRVYGDMRAATAGRPQPGSPARSQAH